MKGKRGNSVAALGWGRSELRQEVWRLCGWKVVASHSSLKSHLTCMLWEATKYTWLHGVVSYIPWLLQQLWQWY